MKTGDKVRVLCQLGLQTTEQWNDGIYRGTTGDTLLIETTGQPKFVHADRAKVKRFDTRIESDEQLAQWAKEKIQILYSLIAPAVETLMPGEQVKLNNPDDGGYEDYYIELCDGEIVVGPCYHERQAIGRIIEDAGWEVARIKWHPATRHEPEDQEHCPISSHPNEGYAAKTAIEEAFKVNAERYWDSKADEAMAEEWATLATD